MKKTLIAAALVASLSIVAIGCDDGDDPTPEPTEAPAAEMTEAPAVETEEPMAEESMAAEESPEA